MQDTPRAGLETIDLRAEQRATLERPPCRYSLTARIFFLGMDLVTGRQTTLAKTVLLESLASIPYREWEARQYARMTRDHGDVEAACRAREIAGWARYAQDNEYLHLLVISDKMRQEGLRAPRYLRRPFPDLVILAYVALSRIASRVSLRRACLFNAEFEDHAEHVYARLVADHPEWEDQPVDTPLIAEYAASQASPTALRTWADVFRRIGLDERDHRDASFVLAGRPEEATTAGRTPTTAGQSAIVVAFPRRRA